MGTIFKALLRYKNSTILNIIGLSCAFATFIIISMQIRYDITYDRHNENYDSIYQLTIKDTTKESLSTMINRQLPIKIKESSPYIEFLTVVNIAGDCRLTILGESEKENNVIIQDIVKCEEYITDIFSFNFIDGDKSALKDKYNLIVSEKFVKRWYGNSSAFGKKILWNNTMMTIAATFETLPKNGTINGDVFCNVSDQSINTPSEWSFIPYIKLKANCSESDFEENIIKDIGQGNRAQYIDTIPMSKIRSIINGYDTNYIYIMMLIALSIVVLAAINFINFATSMVPLKIKGINLRKVVGAKNSELRANVIFESIILAGISFIIALIAVELFKDSSFSYFISDVSWATNKIVYLIAFVIMLFTGIISGLYPAFYSTSFHPALVLKSSYAASASGIRFRKTLIGFQFFIALSFIAITIFIQLQHNYLINRDGGYIKEGIIHVSHDWTYDGHEELRNELLKSPQIKDITFSRSPFGNETSMMGWSRAYANGYMSISVMPVSHNFLDFFEIKIDSGRGFMASDEQAENGYFIMNKTAMEKYELRVGEKVAGHTQEPTDIIGVCEDVHISNMRITIQPYAFYIFGKHPWGNLSHAYIKVSGDPKQIIEHIRSSYIKTDPDVTPEINYLTAELEEAYGEANTTKQIMMSFSLIAIIIALVGVFGLVSFDTKFRRKEVGLRRINGATINDILSMFSTAYVKIVLISFVLSVPIVYFVISKWLELFPYKIGIYWWVFALALAMVLILTVTISIVQTIRIAKENPVNAIQK